MNLSSAKIEFTDKDKKKDHSANLFWLIRVIVIYQTHPETILKKIFTEEILAKLTLKKVCFADIGNQFFKKRINLF